MKQNPLDHRYVVKPLLGAFRVLEALVRAGEPTGITELAKHADVSKPTAFRYLKTLSLLGYVAPMRPGLYEIGPAIWHLGKNIGGERALRALADEALHKLSDTFGETVNLAVANGKRLNYIAILDPQAPLRFSAEVGDSECFHCTALGKAMLAFVRADEVDRHLGIELRRFTDRTITKRSQLQSELTRVRQLGYAIDREENERGCVCYAAPILGGDELPIGALSVSIPTSRLTGYLDVTIPEAVKEAAVGVTAKARRNPELSDHLALFRSARGHASP